MMIDIHQLQDDSIEVLVDTSIYNDWVIEKVLYWLSSDYLIFRKNNEMLHTQTVTLSLKKGHRAVAYAALKEKLSNDFIDFKNRQTIARETANIRDLLFAKAFANNDDFVEFTFQD
jgi:His-Xaa-Ser system protein HxsD